MDSLDLLDSFVGIFFAVLPLLGWTVERRIRDIVFFEANFDLSDENKHEIIRRFEFVGLTTSVLVLTQALVLTILAYYSDLFVGVLIAVLLGYAGVALVMWLWNLGPTRFFEMSPWNRGLVCLLPLLILFAKFAVAVTAVGIDYQSLPRPSAPPSAAATASPTAPESNP